MFVNIVIIGRVKKWNYEIHLLVDFMLLLFSKYFWTLNHVKVLQQICSLGFLQNLVAALLNAFLLLIRQDFSGNLFWANTIVLLYPRITLLTYYLTFRPCSCFDKRTYVYRHFTLLSQAGMELDMLSSAFST